LEKLRSRTPRPSARLITSLETGLALAGTVGLVYVIGGAVMWLRFRQAGLPADQAVALLPKTTSSSPACG
jgi:hypothetical protein